jgi:release factor glutamine methyltransferase
MTAHSMTTWSAIKRAASALEEAGVQAAGRDAVGLAAYVWSTTPEAIGSHFDAPVPEDFWTLVERRTSREPLELIVGMSSFCGRRFLVEPGVFVPKRETEELVARVVDCLRALPTRTPRVVDLCTGSGVVAITVAAEVPGATVTGADLSPQACDLAARNADALGVKAVFECCDVATALPGLDGGVDVVIANPPHIPTGRAICMPEIRDHDPALALWGGSDGLDVVRAVERTARRLLIPGGWLFLEHGPYQVEAVLDLFGGAAWSQIAAHATVADAVLVAQRTGVGPAA